MGVVFLEIENVLRWDRERNAVVDEAFRDLRVDDQGWVPGVTSVEKIWVIIKTSNKCKAA